MKRFRWRLRPLVVLSFVAVTAVAFLFTYGSIRRFLASRLVALLPPDQVERILNEFAGAFLAFALSSLVLVTAIAFLLASLAVRTVARVRAAVIDRARGRGAIPARLHIAELHALGHSIERLASDAEERAEQMQKERDEMNLLVASVSEGILLTDEDGRIIHANPAARRLLGLPANPRGQPLASLIRNLELRSLVERVTEGAPPLSAELTIDERRLLVVTRPVSEDVVGSGVSGALGAVLAFIDLTEVRRLEGVRRDFVANVSHELKTPLTSIRGYVETLLADEVPPDIRHQFLEVVQKNAERLHSIVEDLLDLSRLESGGWRPNIEAVSASAVVTEAWSQFVDRAGAKAIRFEAPASDALVAADPSALRQVLANLFDNAIRHTPEGGAVRVIIEPAPHAVPIDPAHANGRHPGRPFVRIRVEDTGSGIPNDALPRIFERFYRVDPARSRAEGGTGLGLSIVKHLAEAMGGDVAAESSLGKGTAVLVRLPAA